MSIYKMPALKQTLYIEFDIDSKTFQKSGTLFDKQLNVNFEPDYMRIKQVTHFSKEADSNAYYISGNLLNDKSKIFAVAVGNYNMTTDMFFPLGKSVRGNFEFILRSKAGGVVSVDNPDNEPNQYGTIILSIEFTKELPKSY